MFKAIYICVLVNHRLLPCCTMCKMLWSSKVKTCSTVRKPFALSRLFWVRMCTGQGPHGLKQEAKEMAWEHLPLNTAGVLFWGGFFHWFFSSFTIEVDVLVGFCDWQPRGERFDGGWAAHVSLPGPTWYAASSQGAEREDGVSVSANLAGRWLTSPRPSKCDLGHTFNEIHSTWQAPPLPGLSAWSPPLFQSDRCLHVLLLYVQCASLCARVRVCVRRSVCSSVLEKAAMLRPLTKNWINLSSSAPACQLLLFESALQVHCCFQ